MYLLDKNVLDEIDKDQPHKNVDTWWSTINETQVYLSVIAIMEGRKGLEKIREERPQRAQELEGNLQRIIADFQNRILPIDLPAAHAWGHMIAEHESESRDVAIAAIAQVRGFSVVTRNVKHFAKRKVRILNPYKNPPEIINP